jgi:hypothetical protein
MFVNGTKKRAIARTLSIDIGTVREWIKKWLNALPELHNFEKLIDSSPDPIKSKREYTQMILEVFEDRPRCGAPTKFSAE